MATAPTAVIAEDEPMLARTLSRLLEQVWPEFRIVGVAHNGLRATELGLAHAPDVMFLDIKMPGRTGLEVAEAVADDCPTTVPSRFSFLSRPTTALQSRPSSAQRDSSSSLPWKISSAGAAASRAAITDARNSAGSR